MSKQPQLLQHELIDEAINKLAGLIPEGLKEEVLREIIADRVPKAFYYTMLIELLSKTDTRPPEIILTEARFLVSLLLFKVEKKKGITPPQTSI